MANTKDSGGTYLRVKVDTAPGTDGFWTEPLKMRQGGAALDIFKAFFSITEVDNSVTSVVTPSLQWRHLEGDWQDYRNDGEDFAIGDHKVIDGNSGAIEWRAGVKNGNYTSGAIYIVLHW